jgi:hypothetical protein
MSKFDAFMKGNVKTNEEIREVKLERFTEPFKVKALSSPEEKEVRAASKKRVKKGKHSYEEKLDPDTYNDKLMSKSIVYPNLNDAELQDSYGVRGAESLLAAMLTMGEYFEILQAVNEVNGLTEDEDDEDDPVEQAKN